LAEHKQGLISDEKDFLKTRERKLMPHCQLLATCINKLQRKVFPGVSIWKNINPPLYLEMKQTL
ncbi:hypothetical protein BS50DRAFT_509645, partial [Corynespora cassiicola Philippines]